MISLASIAWLGLSLVLASGLALVIISGVVRCAWMLTHPPRRAYAFAVSRSVPGTPDEVPPVMGGPFTYREWKHRSGDTELPVWEIPGADTNGPIVIISHGWGDSRIHSLQRVQAVVSTASRVLLWDLRGHGEAGGTCALGTREVGDLASLMTAVGGPSDRFVLLGHSLGAGVSIAAGSADPRVIGVLAEAPYRFPETPARAVLEQAALPHTFILPASLGITGWRLGQGQSWFGRATATDFDRARLAGLLRCPLLVLHAQDDLICPLDDARSIASAAPSGRLEQIAGAGHTNLWNSEPSRARAIEIVRAFMTELADRYRTT